MSCGLRVDAEVCDEITLMSGSYLCILNFLMLVLATDSKIRTTGHCDLNQWIVVAGRGQLQQKLMRTAGIRSIIDRLEPVLAPTGSHRFHEILTAVFQQGKFKIPPVDSGDLRAACLWLKTYGVLAPTPFNSDVYTFWPSCMREIVLSRLYPVLSTNLEISDAPEILEPIYSNAWLRQIVLLCAREMKPDILFHNRATNRLDISGYIIQGEWWLRLTHWLRMRNAEVIQEALVTSGDRCHNIWIEDDYNAVGIELKVEKSELTTHYEQLYKYATLLKPSQMILVNIVTTGQFSLPFPAPNSAPSTLLDAIVIRIQKSNGTFQFQYAQPTDIEWSSL
ncbi:hypothetical protein C0992_000738 [Termitomyces sp. T32_za158]|nr:hypothetical protein C0992_000738 [Termitomyces sp. T32_za158]